MCCTTVRDQSVLGTSTIPHTISIHDVSGVTDALYGYLLEGYRVRPCTDPVVFCVAPDHHIRYMSVVPWCTPASYYVQGSGPVVHNRCTGGGP